MYKLNRVGVASMAVLLTYNAYGAGYVCDSTKMYNSCDTGYYLTAGAASTVYTPVPVAGNSCTACPAEAVYCDGGTNAPLYTVTLNPNGGVAPVGGWTSLYVFQDATSGNATVCDNSVVSGDDYGPCFDGGVLTSLSGAQAQYFPTREKYTFMGFGPSATATTDQAVISASGQIDTSNLTANANTTLYAIWERSVCDPTQYLESGECKPCPEDYPNSAGGGEGKDSCFLELEPGMHVAVGGQAPEECPVGHWCPGGITVYFGEDGGAKACPTNYDDDTGTGYTKETDCSWNVPGGNYIKNANDKELTPCVSGQWKESHWVKYGSTSTYNTCERLDGVPALSNAPYDKASTCYIPAQTTLNDGKGDYVFTEDCAY